MTVQSRVEPPRSCARLWLGGICLLAALAGVLLITLWPVPIDTGYSGAISKLLGVLHRNGIPEWFGYNKLEFSANVAMFVPLGFLVELLLPTRMWWLALVLCPLFSVSIELTQGFFLSARFSSATDVLSNSIGAIIGITAAVILRLIVDVRDRKIITHAIWELTEGSPSRTGSAAARTGSTASL